MKFDYMYSLAVLRIRVTGGTEYSLLERSISTQMAAPKRSLACWLSLRPLRARRDRNAIVWRRIGCLSITHLDLLLDVYKYVTGVRFGGRRVRHHVMIFTLSEPHSRP